MLGDNFINTGEVHWRLILNFKLRSLTLFLFCFFLAAWHFNVLWSLCVLASVLPKPVPFSERKGIVHSFGFVVASEKRKRYRSFTAINLYYCWVVLTCWPLLVVDAHVKCTLYLNTKAVIWTGCRLFHGSRRRYESTAVVLALFCALHSQSCCDSSCDSLEGKAVWIKAMLLFFFFFFHCCFQLWLKLAARSFFFFFFFWAYGCGDGAQFFFLPFLSEKWLCSKPENFLICRCMFH